MPEVNRPNLVLVHGLWFRAWCMRIISDRLQEDGFGTVRFSYSTTRKALGEGAAALHDLCSRQPQGPVHFLGHSLGGLLILHMLNVTNWDRPGRIVFLGTPLCGSAVVRRVSTWPAGEKLFGQAVEHLGEGVRNWPSERETGMVAGTRPVGLGRATGRLAVPNDGTVAVEETRNNNLTDRVELAVTHTGMLYSAEVVRQAAIFLREGHFGPLSQSPNLVK
jgi:pimeloyl-ACP methyl ester carboxylesterase